MPASRETHPTPGILRGQLSYLFEDEPALRRASAEQLAERLNHDDRWARARAAYPAHSDAEVRAHLGDFEDRISADDVRTAMQGLAGDDPDD